ncbi:hypothetical protein FACS1894191_1240 [Clostridia bacterium]|nr:hypothetical protein FACS1894191_1240 [Clostridia bacterium]
MEIIRAELKNLNAVLELYKQYYAYYEHQQPDYYQKAEADEEYCKKIITGDLDDYLIACSKGEPVGICHVAEKKTPPVGHYVPHRFSVLINIFVAAPHRGSGADKALTDMAKEWSKARKLDYMELRVLHLNDFALHFYERENFEVTAHTMRCML